MSRLDADRTGNVHILLSVFCIEMMKNDFTLLENDEKQVVFWSKSEQDGQRNKYNEGQVRVPHENAVQLPKVRIPFNQSRIVAPDQSSA